MKIGIDVDLTTLKSDEAWWCWLWNMSGENPNASREYKLKRFEELKRREILVSYDLSVYFDDMVNRNVEPMDFWRNEGVYDQVDPRKDAYHAINQLIRSNADNHDFIFITHNKGNGSRSKFNLLDRLFGRDNFYYVVTREKYLVDVDIMIDDRADFLNRFVGTKTYPICLSTPFVQSEPLDDSIILFDDWWNILSHIEKVQRLYNVLENT